MTEGPHEKRPLEQTYIYMRFCIDSVILSYQTCRISVHKYYLFYIKHSFNNSRIFYTVRGWTLVSVYGHTYSKSMDQPGKVANPARGQLNGENEFCPVPVRA